MATKALKTTTISKGTKTGRINRVDAAAVMFGKGSKQHKAAIKKFGPSGGPTAQVIGEQPRDSHGRWK